MMALEGMAPTLKPAAPMRSAGGGERAPAATCVLLLKTLPTLFCGRVFQRTASVDQCPQDCPAPVPPGLLGSVAALLRTAWMKEHGCPSPSRSPRGFPATLTDASCVSRSLKS